MSTYGRNLDFRVPPIGRQRGSRYSVAADTVIGVPVLTTGALDVMGRRVVGLAAADSAIPAPGAGGLMVFEAGPDAFRTFDPNLTTYSDIGIAVSGKAVQVVSGKSVKIVLKNTVTGLFLHTRTYIGRTMVAGMGATPSVAVGDGLTPGVGSDTAGYWKKNAGAAANSWLIIDSIDIVRDEIEAHLNF